MITKNFKVNSLANSYAAAIYHDVTTRNGGDWFVVNSGDKAAKVAIIDGAKGIRMLVDSYLLEAIKNKFTQLEFAAAKILEKCVKDGELTEYGRDIWQDMINDVGNTLAEQGEFQ